jgi:hypothetical protein
VPERFRLTPPTEPSAAFDDAPFRMTETFAIGRPARTVWDELTGVKPLWWCRLLDCEWTSPRPFGVGTTRRVRVLRGALTIEEHYFRWEEAPDRLRHSFSVTSASLPLFRWLAEDYLVVADGDRACRFTWTIAARPAIPGPLAAPPNRLLLGTLFADTRRHYAPDPA